MTWNSTKNGHQRISRKSFLQKSSLSLFALGLSGIEMPVLAVSHSVAGYETGNTMLAETVRTISYNVFNGCIGYKGINGLELPEGEVSDLVKTARKLKQIPRRIMLELDLYSPNIINFSESAKEDVVAQMAKMSNLNYAFFSSGKENSGGHPGCILTTYDIVSSQNRPFVHAKDDVKELFTRHWGKASLRTPGGKTIIVHSAHLWPFRREPRDTEIRLREIEQLIIAVKEDLKKTDLILLQGDLNHTPDTEEYQQLKKAGFTDAFVVAGTGDGFTTNADTPVKRIDFIYGVGAMAKGIRHCRPLFEGAFRMNSQDPKSFALSDHLPVLADFVI